MTEALKDAASATSKQDDVNSKRILTVEEMLAADDIEYREVPGWMVKDPKTGQLIQGYVRIGSLNAEQVAEWRDTAEGPAKKTMGIRLFVDSLVNEKNERIGNSLHYAAFKKKSNAIQDRVLEQIIDLNGLRVTKKAETEAKNA